MLKKLVLGIMLIIVATVAIAYFLNLLKRSEIKEISVVLPGGEKVKIEEVTEELILPKTWKPITKVYDITYTKPLREVARIVFRYDPSKLQDVDIDSLQVLIWINDVNGFGYWYPLPSKVFKENNTVIVETYHFSKVGLFARYKNIKYEGVVEALEKLLEKPPSKPDCVVGFLLYVDRVVVSARTYPLEYFKIMSVVSEKVVPYLKRVGGLRFAYTDVETNHIILMVGCKADPSDGWDVRGEIYDFVHQKVVKTYRGTKLSAEVLIYDILVSWYFDCGDNAEVIGKVVTEEGKGVRDALVIALDVFGKEYKAKTDSTGFYRMLVQSGLYEFTAIKRCCSGVKECLVCAYGRLGEVKDIKAPDKKQKTEVNITIEKENYIEILADITITAKGVKTIGVITHTYETVVRERYNLTFTYDIINQTEDGYKYFEGVGVIIIEYYSVDAKNTLECSGPEVYMKVDISYSGNFSQKRDVVVSGWISPNNEIIDINVYIADAPPNALFCEPDAGTAHVHILISTPQTKQESEQTRSFTPSMYPRDIKVVIESLKPHIRVDKVNQRRDVSFELLTSDYLMCITKGIGGGALSGIELPKGVPSFNLGDVTFKFAGTLVATTCTCED